MLMSKVKSKTKELSDLYTLVTILVSYELITFYSTNNI